MQDRGFQYARREPETTVLYQVIAGELETFLTRQQERDHAVPRFVEDEFRSYLDCGILARGEVVRPFYSGRQKNFLVTALRPPGSMRDPVDQGASSPGVFSTTYICLL